MVCLSQIHFPQIQNERSDWRSLRSYLIQNSPPLFSPPPSLPPSLPSPVGGVCVLPRIELCSWFLCVNIFWLSGDFYFALAQSLLTSLKGAWQDSVSCCCLWSFTISCGLHPRTRGTKSHLSVAIIKYFYRSCMMRLQWTIGKKEGVLESLSQGAVLVRGI